MGGFRLTIAVALIAFVAAIVIAGALYQAIGMRRDARRFPAPGRFLRIGDARIRRH